MAQEQANESGPPLGSAPGYGGLTEGVTGGQGTGKPQQQQSPSVTPMHDQARGSGEKQSQPRGDADSDNTATSDTPLFKEELLPDEKGTSLDEGGAG